MADRITKSIIVNSDIHDVYTLWADFENFPHFMRHLKSVTKTGERLSHWVMEGPLGRNVEWDARTTIMEEDRRIGWSSTGGDLETNGEVLFTEIAPGQTEVTVSMFYDAGTLGQAVASLFDDPEAKLEDDLRDFKEYCEGVHVKGGTQFGATGGTGSMGMAGGGYGTPGTTGTSTGGLGGRGGTLRDFGDIDDRGLQGGEGGTDRDKGSNI